jgi:ribosomal protein S8
LLSQRQDRPAQYWGGEGWVLPVFFFGREKKEKTFPLLFGKSQMAPIHNLCSQIQNSFKWRLRRIAVPESKTNRAIVQILYEEGFISSIASGDNLGPYNAGFEVPITPDNVSRRRIWLDLKYKEGEPVLSKMKLISKPSRKVFATNQELKAIASAKRAGPLLKAGEVGQITILKTDYGIVEMKDALKKNVGGEVICIAV